MTSEERREARYQRRKRAREEKRRARSAACGSFEEVFSYENLYHSAKLCCRNVAWKCSTQAYRFNVVVNIEKARQELISGKYRGRGFVEFDLCERGKLRHIRSVHISERVVQRTLCDRAIIPLLTPSLIYDNGASLQGKGFDFALNRVTCHLQRYWRKHGNKGYVLLFDFSSLFVNADHQPVKKELERRVYDERIRKLANQCLDNFGDKGYGLGSQISQIAAITLPSKLDHTIKEELKIKGYARYMDDAYLIHEDKAYLEFCLERIKEVCEELGIVLNPRKTKIRKLEDGFDFLKIKFKLKENGKVLRKMSYQSAKIMRRKLKKFRRWNDEGRWVRIGGQMAHKEFALEDTCKAYSSWRSHMMRGDNYFMLKKMDAYFEELFGINPNDSIAWRCVFEKKEGIECIESLMLRRAH